MSIRNINPHQFNGGNEYTSPRGQTYTLEHVPGGFGEIAAYAKRGNHRGTLAGTLITSASEPQNTAKDTIKNLSVSPKHARQGLASAMFDFARVSRPNLHHSDTLTEDGKKFAAATPREWSPQLGGLTTDRGFDEPVVDWSDSRFQSFKQKNQLNAERRELDNKANLRQQSEPKVEQPKEEQLRLF